MTSMLTNKYQALLGIGPMGICLANDYGGNEASDPRHKKSFMMIPFAQVRDMHALYIHPPGTGPNSMLNFKPSMIDESKIKKQFQILY